MTTEIFTDSYTLSNGVNIPKLGLGTWFIDDDKAAQAVIDAVGIGYRHIDTAQAYENERGIGEGVRKCGIARNDLFITSKLAAEAKTYDEAVRAIDETLDPQPAALGGFSRRRLFGGKQRCLAGLGGCI